VRFSPHPAQASTKAPFRHPVSRLNFSCCLHNTRLQPLDLTLNISPCQARRCIRQCNSVHLLSFCKRGSTNSLVTRDHKEVCPLSRGVTFKPLSARLQGGITLFPHSFARTSIGVPCGSLARCSRRRYGFTVFHSYYTDSVDPVYSPVIFYPCARKT
jgi:hypothetical protein